MTEFASILVVQGCIADVSQREQCTSLVAAASAAFGGALDVLVNNVGTNVRRPGGTLEYSAADYGCVMGTNLESAYVMCQLCHPLLKAAGSSAILFNSSVAGGPNAMRSGTLYAMSKVGGHGGQTQQQLRTYNIGLAEAIDQIPSTVASRQSFTEGSRY